MPCSTPYRGPSLLALVPQLLISLVLLSPRLASADDWPQWRGPQRDAKSAETGLLGDWKEGGPPLAWQAAGLGNGFSSLAVVGNRLYTLGDLPAAEGQAAGQYVLALDAKDGHLLWKTALGPAWADEYGGPRGTPTVDGDRLYVLGTEGDVACLETASGKKVWSRSLPNDFGGKMMAINGTNWKFAESPLVDGDRLIVTPGSAQAALVALDKKTGTEIWRTALPALGAKGADGAGYSSVVVSEAAGVRQYVQLLGRGVIGVEVKTGRFLWGYNKVANDVANIPTPIVDGDRIFVSTGYGTGAALLQLAKEGDGVKAEEVYFLAADTFQNHHGGMILDHGYVYAGSGHNKGFPVSLHLADGKLAWGPVRNAGQGSAAMTYADGRLYLRYQNGTMVLAEATPEAYREHGTFTIPEVKHPSWSHPVVAGGRLYLREQDRLYCYDVRRPSTSG